MQPASVVSIRKWADSIVSLSASTSECRASTPCIRRYAACVRHTYDGKMQVACKLHAFLVGPRLYRSFVGRSSVSIPQLTAAKTGFKTNKITTKLTVQNPKQLYKKLNIQTKLSLE